MPARKKTATRSAKLASPKELYARLYDTHQQTILRMQRLEETYGFGDFAVNTPEDPPAVTLAVAIDFTADPDMLKATFVVPRKLACEMLDSFAAYGVARAVAA